MDKTKQLTEAAIELSENRREPGSRRELACNEAFELARRFEVSIGLVGRVCNQNNIKICKCQLGCFK